MIRTFALALVSNAGLVALCCLAQLPDEKPDILQVQRKRLVGVEGMTAEQVLKTLGKPDDVRHVPEGGVLDGVRHGAMNAPEVERWAYGRAAKGKFARLGIVGLDRDGKVVIARSPDVFSDPTEKLPERVLPKDDKAVVTPSKMSCHIGPAEYIASEKVLVKGIGTWTAPEGLKMTVSLKNAGPTTFELKDDAAGSVTGLLIVELYDADGVLLFRDNYVRYHSTVSFDPAKWPVLSVPAGREKSKEFVFRPDGEFGPLPAGKYSVRVYFPFAERKYYPSNLVHFEWKK